MTGLDLSLVDDCTALAEHVADRFEASIAGLVGQGVEGGLLDARRVEAACRHRGGPLPARALQYFDLGLRLMQDDEAGAGLALEDLGQEASWDRVTAVQPFDSALLGRDFDRLAALMFGERIESLRIEGPGPEDLERIRAQHDDVLAAISALAPEIGDEFEALVDVVVLAAPTTPELDSYGSATTLAAMGLILINPIAALGFLDHFGTYVHEVTHMVLHALTGDERLSVNDEHERFSSPLRTDPRPMEGVVHATIVCARMAAMYQRLAASDDQRRGDSHARAVDLHMRFEDGASLIERSATLSPLGHDIWNRTRELTRMECPRSSTAQG